jgi:hypothetical protein
MYPFTYTSSSTSKCLTSHEDISEPLLRAEIYSQHDNQHCNTSEISRTKPIVPFNTLRTLLLLWIGILVGTLSAKMGLCILYELDPFLVLSYLQLNENDNNSDTSTFVRVMTFQNLFLTNVVAFFWSLSTVGTAYMVYKFIIIPFFRFTEAENHHTTSPSLDNETIVNDLYQFETNHTNDKDTNDGNEYSRQEMDQLMITIGTCIGFTITCIIYDLVSV